VHEATVKGFLRQAKGAAQAVATPDLEAYRIKRQGGPPSFTGEEQPLSPCSVPALCPIEPGPFASVSRPSLY